MIFVQFSFLTKYQSLRKKIPIIARTIFVRLKRYSLRDLPHNIKTSNKNNNILTKRTASTLLLAGKNPDNLRNLSGRKLWPMIKVCL